MTEETATNPADGGTTPDAEVEIDTPELELDDQGNPVEPEHEPEEETEEVERDGKKYTIPKALKPELLMQADYTRKTQELAAQRRDVEALQAQAVQSSAEHIQAIAKVVAIKDLVDQYDKVDWDAWRAHDQQNGTNDVARLMIEQKKVQQAFDTARSDMNEKETQRALGLQQATAKRTQDALEVLARDIPGWSADLAGKLDDYAVKEYGFTQAEVGQVARQDPRLIKLLHRAYVNDQTKSKQAAGKRVADAAAVKPSTSVGASSPAAKDPSRMSTAQWIDWRNQQERKKRS